MKFLLMLCLLFLIPSCGSNNSEVASEEVRSSERAFAKMAGEKGIAKAFLHFAEDSAVLYRQNHLYKGKKEILRYFENNAQLYTNARLEWAPDHIEVSSSGDLASTYGPYTFFSMNEEGEERVNTGFFHTVWKKKETGDWRYIWD